MATFIVQVVVAHISKVFLVPSPTLLKKAIGVLTNIGNLINQQTRYIHTIKKLTEQNYQFLLDQITDIREKLNKIYTQPIHIEDLVRSLVKKHGKSVHQRIQKVLKEFDYDN